MRSFNKFIFLSVVGLVLSSFSLPNLSELQKPKSDKPYMIVGQMPRFPGGKAAMQRYISDHMNYPFDALKHNIQGKVNVEFVVDKDGTLTEIKTMGKKLGYGLEEQAIKIFQGMPKWVPGRQDGIAVPVYMMIPILFTI